MDKVNKYKKIVRQVVEEIVALSPEIEDGIENQLITDDEHGHYLYFGVGWENGTNKWFYATFIHIDVKPNGRVWLQHDGTDLRIAERLAEKGISKSDIVIGFQPPHVREDMLDYAVA
jgi:XisI protein